MSEYTPTTEKLREVYVSLRLSLTGGWEGTYHAEFDRWLAEHDRIVIEMNNFAEPADAMCRDVSCRYRGTIEEHYEYLNGGTK